MTTMMANHPITTITATSTTTQRRPRSLAAVAVKSTTTTTTSTTTTRRRTLGGGIIPSGAFGIVLLSTALLVLLWSSACHSSLIADGGELRSTNINGGPSSSSSQQHHHNHNHQQYYTLHDDRSQEEEEEEAEPTPATTTGSRSSSSSASSTTCSIYMAPASAHGNNGYGIYTTRPVRRGEAFLQGPDVPSIPILDYWLSDDDDDDHHHVTTTAANETDHDRGVAQKTAAARRHFHDVFSNYWWTHGKPDHVAYLADQSADFQLTFGALPNHHCLLHSLEAHYPSSASTTTSNSIRYAPYADRRAVQTPAAGAYSYNGGRVFVAGRDVQAGEEIYLNYGHCERNADEPTEWYNFIPMPTDYEEAAKIIHRHYIPTYLERGELPTERALLELHRHYNISTMVMNLLPTSIDQVQILIEHGMEKEDEDVDERFGSIMAQTIALHTASERRTPEWIVEHGVCLEHLVAQPSTIPYAGQGAFAQHVIRAGEIVVPVPLLQVLDRDGLQMYNHHHDDAASYQMEQLLVNYCLGHADSSMLLCPMTNAALINHAPASGGDDDNDGKNEKKRRPNAAFRWHESSRPWFNTTIDEFWRGNGRGLRMDVIALRDINVGEEVLVDYGSAWETAWQDHLRTDWAGPMRYSTEDLNAQPTIPDRFLSHDLRRRAVEDSYIVTGCQYYMTGDENRPDFHRDSDDDEEDDFDWRDLDDEELLRRYSDNEDGWYDGDYESHYDKAHWPCTVIRQEDGPSSSENSGQPPRYLVRIHQHAKHRDAPWEEHDVPRYLRVYPRNSIHFFTKPYASDQLLSRAFRHPVGIPDAMFPTAWRNRRTSSQHAATGPALDRMRASNEGSGFTGDDENQSLWEQSLNVIETTRKGVAASTVQSGP